MMADIPKIKRNISKMIDMGAPESDIDEYVKSEGITLQDLQAPAQEITAKQVERRPTKEGIPFMTDDGPAIMRNGNIIAIPQSEFDAISQAAAMPSAGEAAATTLDFKPSSENIDAMLDPDVVVRDESYPIGEDENGEMMFAVPQRMLNVISSFMDMGKGIAQVGQTGVEAIGGAPMSGKDVAEVATSIMPQAIASRGIPRLIPRSKAAPVAPAQVAPDVVDEVAGFGGRSPEAQEQALARFQNQDVPATRGNITQSFQDQAKEADLLSLGKVKKGEPLRQRVLEQSEKFKDSVTRLVDSLGVSDRAGLAIKEGLEGRRELLRNEKNALYKSVADAGSNVTEVPIFTDSIIEALPNANKWRRAEKLSPQATGAIDDLLVEYGIDKSDEAIEAFLKPTRGNKRPTITPLTLGNFENFRADLNAIWSPDLHPTSKAIISDLKSALDSEAGFIDSAIRESGVTDQSVVKTLGDARQRVIELKTEFNPKSIIGKLTDNKKNSNIPNVEASKVSEKLLAKGTPVEDLERVITSLGDAPGGNAAIGDLQSSFISNALEAALKAKTEKIAGIQTIGSNNFAKYISQFDDKKLNVLFKNNPEALKNLKELEKIATDITPANAAVPKGGAVLVPILKKMARTPGIAAITEVVEFAVKAGADERALAKALSGAPKRIKTNANLIRRQMPELAARLGLASQPIEKAP